MLGVLPAGKLYSQERDIPLPISTSYSELPAVKQQALGFEHRINPFLSKIQSSKKFAEREQFAKHVMQIIAEISNEEELHKAIVFLNKQLLEYPDREVKERIRGQILGEAFRKKLAFISRKYGCDLTNLPRGVSETVEEENVNLFRLFVIVNYVYKNETVDYLAEILQKTNPNILDDIHYLFENKFWDSNREESFMVELANRKLPEKALDKLADNPSMLVKSAVAENCATPAMILYKLSKDTSLSLKIKVAENHNTDAKTHYELVVIEDEGLRGAIASNPNAPKDLLSALSKNGSFYVRMKVINNPSLPIEDLNRLAEDTDSTIREEAQKTITALAKKFKIFP